MIARAAVLFVALALLALLSGWLADILAPRPSVSEPERHTPDFYLTGVAARTMDEHGKLQHRMSAERIVHYGDDDSSELLEPRFYAYDEQGPRWEVSSERGNSSGDGKVVRLSGAVTMTQLRDAEGRLHTRDLLLRPREDYVETAAGVTFADATSRIGAVGLRGHIGENGRLELLANVRGTHVPKKN